MNKTTVTLFEASEAHIRDVGAHVRGLREKIDAFRNTLLHRNLFLEAPVRVESHVRHPHR